MRKFLLITYYWPPAGGGGAMRWVKFCKYIREFGWEPIVYTPENGETAAYDQSLLTDLPPDLTVVKTPIWEPYQLYKFFSGRKKEEKVYSGFISEGKQATLGQRLSVLIRGQFFIPDARMFWIRPSIRFLRKYLRDHPVEAIVSTGPPHSLHLIGEGVHQATGIPWIADFRDAWTKIDFYEQLKLSRSADRRHRALEQRILRGATRVVAVTTRTAEEFEQLADRHDIAMIPNGYDDADFCWDPPPPLDETFSLVHVGSMNSDRNPEALWGAIQDALAQDARLAQHLRLRLVGPVDFSIKTTIKAFQLEPFAEFIDFVPHQEAIEHLQRGQVLLLLVNDSAGGRIMIPGKTYEYLGANRPMLAICAANSNAAEFIQTVQGGEVCDYDDRGGITRAILHFFEKYLAGALNAQSVGIERFTRRNLAAAFAELLNHTTTTR